MKFQNQIHRFMDLWMPPLARSSWGGGTSLRRTMSCRHGAESCAGVDELGIQEIFSSLMMHAIFENSMHILAEVRVAPSSSETCHTMWKT